jgi:hypothetical protein
MRPSRTTFPSRFCSSIYQSGRSQTRPFSPRAMQQHIKRAYQSIMTSKKLQIHLPCMHGLSPKFLKGKLEGIGGSKKKISRPKPWKQTDRSLPTQGWSSNCPFTRNKLLRQQVHKTLINYLWPIMTTCPSYHSKCTHSRQVNHRRATWIRNLWDFSVILSVIPTTIGFLLHFGRFGFTLLSVCQFRY